MIQLKNLSFDYADTPLLKNIDLKVEAGQLLHLRGDNGSGKTTLLKIMAGLLMPTEGQIYFEKQTIEPGKKSYQSHLCYIGHKLGISSALTPRENCFFDLRNRGSLSSWEAALRELSLSEIEHVPCGRLSAGQRRRVSLLRLLMSDAKLWLLDEPFVALDPHAIHFLKDKIHLMLQSGGAVILTSHQSLPFHQETYLEYSL